MATSDKVRERWKWIAEYIKVYRGGTDILNAQFVDDFVLRFNVPVGLTWWGANKCPTLGRDLAAMKKRGYLKRSRVGLGMNWQPGFPRWVWSYELGNMAEYLIDLTEKV